MTCLKKCKAVNSVQSFGCDETKFDRCVKANSIAPVLNFYTLYYVCAINLTLSF